MSELKDILCNEIAENGPMNLASYMRRALTDPKYGYYMQRHPFGIPDHGGGDFITAPEVSQIFGELLGAWIADLWQRMGAPKQINLIELGPGRGTLMADMLRAASVLPAFQKAAKVIFVEVSPALRALQKQAVPQAHWLDDTAYLPPGPCIFVGNEFFDALPIQQFKRQGDSWLEVHVTAEKNTLHYIDVEISEPGFSEPLSACLPEYIENGAIVESSPDSETVMKQISTHIADHGGAALFIDYGHKEPAYGDSFQALEKHKYTDPLASPGMADLTAHVNFPLLANIAHSAGLRASPIVNQGTFLEALGLNIRAQQLMQASPGREQQINDERLRLAAPQHMGQLFKILGVAHCDMPPLAGFPA